MSQENVEIVRRALATALDGSWDPEFWAEDIEWQASPDEPDVGGVRGREAVMRAVTDWFDHLGPQRLEIEECIDAGDEVLVFGRIYLEGVPAGFPGYYVYSVADRKVVRVRPFGHKEQAFEAVGLSEQDAHADS